MTKIRAREVDSSFIAWVGWVPERHDILIVSFKSGTRYLYLDVPIQRTTAMRFAPSVGKYYCQFIRGKYPCFRLHVDDPQSPISP